jgi:hypothetical protein
MQDEQGLVILPVMQAQMLIVMMSLLSAVSFGTGIALP